VPRVCSETYQYYDLPFCSSQNLGYKMEGLGEVFEGDRLVTTMFDVSFRVDKDNESSATSTWASRDVREFRKSVPGGLLLPGMCWKQ